MAKNRGAARPMKATNKNVASIVGRRLTPLAKGRFLYFFTNDMRSVRIDAHSDEFVQRVLQTVEEYPQVRSTLLDELDDFASKYPDSKAKVAATSLRAE